MANNGFTFWENMKDSIDVFEDPVMKYKLYDALAEYALYGVKPEKSDPDYFTIMMFLQSIEPSLKKSSSYLKEQQDASLKGGKNTSYKDEDLNEAVREAAKSLNHIPKRKDIVEMYSKLFGKTPSERTIGRRISDERIAQLAAEVI